MKRTQTKNEKIDNLYRVIILLLWIILFLGFKLAGLSRLYLSFPIYFALSTIPVTLRRKKQFKSIGELKDKLGISIERMRQVIGAGEYDLVAWEKDKMFISPKQMYQLEEYLENQYLIKFGKKYVSSTSVESYSKENQGKE